MAEPARCARMSRAPTGDSDALIEQLRQLLPRLQQGGLHVLLGELQLRPHAQRGALAHRRAAPAAAAAAAAS